MDSRQANFIAICERCRGRCCYQARPPLTKTRAETISRYLKEKNGEDLLIHIARYSHPEEIANGYCILYDHTSGLCRAHVVKPETCVAGPITFDINPRKGVVEWYLKKEKICPLAGEMALDEETFSKHLEVARREMLRLIDELDSSELQAILEIEEEDTIKISENLLPERVVKKLRDGY